MSFDPRPGKPYVWVSWLTGLVSGDKNCTWAAWLKSNFTYRKRPDPDENALTRWKADHATMLSEYAEKLRDDARFDVAVEDQNKFTYRGRIATIGAKPDIIVRMRENSEGIVRALAFGRIGDGNVGQSHVLARGATIVDTKTGKERDSDVVQVALYMKLAPDVLDDLKGRPMSGVVVYKTRERQISAVEAEALWPRIVEKIRIVAGADAPPRTPSPAECRYCDIADCPERDTNAVDPSIDGDLF